MRDQIMQSQDTKNRIKEAKRLKISIKKTCKKCRTKLFDLEKILGFCAWHFPNSFYGPKNAPNGTPLLSIEELKKRKLIK